MQSNDDVNSTSINNATSTVNDQLTNIATVDIREDKDWEETPTAGFNEVASLEIAKWILWIFSGVYIATFILAFITMFSGDATADSRTELVKFMLNAIIPLVTLAVGYYLGNKNTSN